MANAQYRSLLTSIRHSSPYIRSHRGRTMVLGIPGEAIQEIHATAMFHDIALLNAMGIRLVICHGARPQIELGLRQAGLHSSFAQGLRLTDGETLRTVKQAASGVRMEIEAVLSMGLADTTMAGASIRVISGNFVCAQPIGVRDGVDFQYTGQVRKIDVDGIDQLLNSGAIVLLSPLGYSPTGEIFNVSAEEITAQVAQRLQADKAIYFINQKIPQDSEPLREFSLAMARQQLQGKLPAAIRVHLQWAIDSCEKGVKRVHFIDQSLDGALLMELFTRDGCGLMVSADFYEGIRQAKIDDIGGILDLIEVLEDKQILVRRSRQKLETEIDYFSVMERDGMIIGCGALYPFANVKIAELACLAVNPNYFATGRGLALLEHLEKKAKTLGLTKIFVLTTQTSHWFLERGFNLANVVDLPIKHQAMYNYRRNSKVLLKRL